MSDRFVVCGWAIVGLLMGSCGVAWAQEGAAEQPDAAEVADAADAGEGDPADPAEALDETVITATRTETPVSQLTRSVTLLDRPTIEQQSAISRDLGDILGKTVPGFATSTEGQTNFTQTLRGRRFLVMVDGVPVSIPIRDSGRDLKIIDPEALERIEVIRGGTAIYGFGATGGLVNYITRDPQGEQISGFSEAGLGFSTEHPGDSLRWHTAHGATGQAGPVDFVVLGSFAQRNSYFDADGDRIAPDPLSNQGGLADTDEWNVLGKFGLDFDGARQRVEVMVNHYDIEQDTDFVTVPGDVAAGQKARATKGTPLGNQGETENTLVNFTYEHRDVWGSRLTLQAYHLDYFASFPITEFATGQPAPDDTDAAGSINESEKIGTRLTIETPLFPESLDMTAVWGVDFLNERTNEQVVGPNAVFGTPDIPQLEQNALAGFFQLEVPVSDLGIVRAGVRHEAIWLDVPTFTGPGGLFGPGGTVTGGELSYSETLFNLSGVYYLTEQMELFGGFSQGFSVVDVGSVLRGPAFSGGGGGSAENLDPEAQKVDNYEVGVRGDWGRVRGSLAAFYSESDLGTTFQSFARVNRQPEEIWGIESSIEFQPHHQWRFGGTLTVIDSRTDGDGDGDLDEELPNRRIPPMKLTGFVEYEPFDWWRNRLQLLYSGDREPSGATNFNGAPDDVESFVIVDYYASFKAGPGNVRLGVENVLNEDYFPVAAQAFGTNAAYSKGQGRSVSLSYRFEW